MTIFHKKELCAPGNTGKIGYRPLWILQLSLLLRAVHQVGAAVYLSSYLLDEVTGPPLFYLVLAGVSGIFLFITEGMRHRELYRELSGMITLVKLVLLGLAYHDIFPATATVIVAFVLASIGSHAPKIYRHKLLY